MTTTRSASRHQAAARRAEQDRTTIEHLRSELADLRAQIRQEREDMRRERTTHAGQLEAVLATVRSTTDHTEISSPSTPAASRRPTRRLPKKPDASSAETKLPWWDDDPLYATLAAMGLKPRTYENAPYRSLRVISLFVLPSLVIFVGGEQLVHRDVALTVAGAFLGVQLAPLWTRVTQAFDLLLKEAHEDGTPPWRLLRTLASTYVVGQPHILVTTKWVPCGDDGYTNQGTVEGPRGYQTMIDRARVRRVERIWRHRVRVYHRGVIAGQATGPASMPARWYPRRWSLRRRWSLWRCRRLLRFLGKMLRRHDLSHEVSERDFPVRLATRVWFNEAVSPDVVDAAGRRYHRCKFGNTSGR